MAWKLLSPHWLQTILLKGQQNSQVDFKNLFFDNKIYLCCSFVLKILFYLLTDKLGRFRNRSRIRIRNFLKSWIRIRKNNFGSTKWKMSTVIRNILCKPFSFAFWQEILAFGFNLNIFLVGTYLLGNRTFFVMFSKTSQKMPLFAYSGIKEFMPL